MRLVSLSLQRKTDIVGTTAHYEERGMYYIVLIYQYQLPEPVDHLILRRKDSCANSLQNWLCQA